MRSTRSTRVECWTQPTDDDLARLRDGVELDDGPTRPAGVRRIDGARIELTIHEGRNRQVKRMLEAVGHRVRRLHRSRYANLTVDGLEPGEWRELRARRSPCARTSDRRVGADVSRALSAPTCEETPQLALVCP